MPEAKAQFLGGWGRRVDRPAGGVSGVAVSGAGTSRSPESAARGRPGGSHRRARVSGAWKPRERVSGGWKIPGGRRQPWVAISGR